MTVLSWQLSVAPAQTPDAWGLFVDGVFCLSLAQWAPYVGVGAYSVDLAQVSASAVASPMTIPKDGAAHSYAVALVGKGGIGPLSPAVSITLLNLAVTVAATLALPIFPAADTVASTI